ncbi:short-chain dehydrogenase/reductase [Amycolatopsis orientalis]|uniref:short-chain dehydrogenase/reductase n=1 Tax=Amycolatopsis orientalis TaxID=31958 RepID=UPI0003A36E85|nr:short-chain dehydrogenase/reductase [Amycolatopsis orientalis]
MRTLGKAITGLGRRPDGRFRRAKFDLTGRVVFLTGGGRGIGAATAELLVGRGARVALVDRDADAVQQLATRLGARARAYVADVRDLDALENTATAVVDQFGGIDVTVANAGVLGPVRTIGSIDPAAFRQVIEVNLLGVWHTVRATLPHVLERDGYLLSVASVAAALPTPSAAAYGTSKAAVEAFGRALRLELAATGTRVGIAYFGLIESDLVRGARTQPAGATMLDVVPAVMRPAPTRVASAAIVRGIERRSARVHAPGWVPGPLAARTLLEPVLSVLPAVPRLVASAQASRESAVTERTNAERTNA